MKPQRAQRNTLCSQKKQSTLSFPCKQESGKSFTARASAFAGIKSFSIKKHNADCWTTIERIITMSTQRGGNKISFNSFIFNIFSVFSVVKF